MIYFALIEELSRVKIGFARVPERRRTAGQIWSAGFELKLYKAVPGDRDVEKRLHALWSHARIRNEWFDFARIKDSIDALANAVPIDLLEEQAWREREKNPSEIRRRFGVNKRKRAAAERKRAEEEEAEALKQLVAEFEAEKLLTEEEISLRHLGGELSGRVAEILKTKGFRRRERLGGVVWTRSPAKQRISPEEITFAKALKAEGKSIKAIALEMNVSYQRAYACANFGRPNYLRPAGTQRSGAPETNAHGVNS